MSIKKTFTFSTLSALLFATQSYAFDVTVDSTTNRNYVELNQPAIFTFSVEYSASPSEAASRTTSISFAHSNSDVETVVSSDTTTCSDLTTNTFGQSSFSCPLVLQANTPQTIQVQITANSIPLDALGIVGRITASNAETDRFNNDAYPTIQIVNQVRSNPQQTLASANNASVVRAIDVNGDSYKDLLVGSHGASTVKIFINQGNGLFSTTPISLPGAATPSANEILAGDIDGDDLLDLIVTYPSIPASSGVPASTGGLVQYEINDQQVFSVGNLVSVSPQDIRSAALVDITGDALPDLILGNKGPNLIVTNTGSSISQANSPSLSIDGNFETRGVLTALINDDTVPDIFFMNQDGLSYIYESISTETSLATRFPTPEIDDNVIFSSNFIAGKFTSFGNGDETPDFIGAGIPGVLGRSVDYGQGYLVDALNFNHSFNSASFAPVPNSITDLLVSDFDNNGRDDLYLQLSNGDGLLYSRGSRKQNVYDAAPVAYNTVSNPVVTSADINNDNYPDLIAASQTNGGTQIFFNPLGSSDVSTTQGSESGGAVFSWIYLLLLPIFSIFYLRRKKL
ncbi:FG-GAP repeat domain-containing protein [Pelagibaculum spongiae]|uniref:VCBS repeat-containing protein n=1 Tax=Pelagibaculum spongiae TaxID=2080658 RepID=A0A2V1GZV3_9GAMM|nr:VCBS repeat-containing protein [Pelagibaculum spongiae]PVZ71733.1 hypothetical protein DC094_01520 [Pelagibaculum spongiae]